MVKLAGVFRKFRPIKVLLIGDFMLDKYTIGTIDRISPEAPVSVLHVNNDHSRPGGAGNVVLNLLALKAEVRAVGRIGKDEDGIILKNALEKAGADVENIIIQKDYPTPVKNRVIAGSQQVIRIDREKKCYFPKKLEKNLIKNLSFLIKDQDIVAISDYGKGFLSKELISKIIEEASNQNILVIIDPKGRDFEKYRNCFMIKPNLKEAYLAANLSINESLEKVAKILFEKTNAKKLLITRSEAGITIFDRKKLKRKDFPAISKEVNDVTGAGDSVLSILAVCIANKFNIDDGVCLANLAAGIGIEHIGCARVTLSDLAKRLLEFDVDNKVFEESHLFALQEVLKNKKFVILGLDSKYGINTHIFRAISKLYSKKPKCKLLIYVKDNNPEDDFVSFLSSLTAVDFIVLKQESLKSLCGKIHPHNIYEIKENEIVKLNSIRGFLRD